MAMHQNGSAFFRSSLRAFRASEASLRILRTVPASESAASSPIEQLMVLDSSFNPPTRAHLHIATSALEAHGASRRPTRLVLLLATQNADKPAQPASFEHRLCMMSLLAEDVIRAMRPNDDQASLAVDIGVTTLPYFVGKAKALASEQNYAHGSRDGKPVQQVHLVGYDTLIRIFDPKYYPPDHTLRPLQELFDHHRLRVVSRPDSKWGTIQDQLQYIQKIRSGDRGADGAQKDWADKIDLVESSSNEDNVSSTKVRSAATTKDGSTVRDLCSTSVSDYVLREGLYQEH